MTLTSGQLEQIRVRLRYYVDIEDYTICYCCKSTGLTDKDLFCPICGFPQRGSQDDMQRFMWALNNKKALLAENKDDIDKGRHVLLVLAGANLFYAILLGLIINIDIQIFMSSTVEAGIYLGLAAWSRKQAFPAILSGFFVFIVIVVIKGIENPVTILLGFQYKLIFLALLIWGYIGVKKNQDLERELAISEYAKDLNMYNDLSKL